ncbi:MULTISPECIES: amino acid ABC transporter ATP-binding protein [Methylobacterium]|jgi:polar amino acid transport system ATP-binding protein|uniref:Phosphate ABC transporter ATP-binding protein n=2 Tax=Methylobacterium TaxID=407 RepID=A0A0C6FP35_9HYPH|nr:MULTISPECIES: amino acid ABC transporter ATP-binding protein [Methylobacterium]MBK3397327.1 amino acid ABC transporter ATP-binding protein [Methylobacterium ajmalii]MBK3412686.1 amino acid ABC transporter ATP-binding protein [Methylobacterium ajmalii]MBK3420609.1 amino acid ABC transporter ATP-binding protein [Methylobacterium ajmalii]MBZ6416313.1 amino acid ABC transporter ATP-binding protein [Methylobacterium sp.]SEP07135.1 polar amino acid transport system ATP-binding protein [Methylobac
MTLPPSAIAIRGLCKSYGKAEVLHDIDLEIARGATTCLIGPSGSGKSTLLRCIAFLEEATRGTILIDGQPLGFEERPDGKRVRLPPHRIRAVRAGIGMVFQQFNLWPHMTALGNVTEALVTVKGLSRAEADARGMAQLRRVGLEARARHYPSELSGGQQQRVAIARALALEPAILLFDEPTASLDPELTGEVLNVMRDLGAEGMTMVVVTHEIGFAATVGQRIAFLDHGRVLLNGTPGELFAAPRHPRLTQFLETYLDRGAAMLLQPA